MRWSNQPARRSVQFTDADLATLLNALREFTVHVQRSARLRRAVTLRSNERLLLLQARAIPGASISELAAELHTDASAVSVLVTRLCRRRLLARERSSRDGRRSVVSITSQGVAALGQLPSPIVLRGSATVLALSPEFRRELASHLLRLVHVLETATSRRIVGRTSRRA